MKRASVPFAVLVVMLVSSVARAQAPTPEGATRQADATAQKDAVRVTIAHTGPADACGANGEKCTAKEHWSYAFGNETFPPGSEGETKLGNALKSAATKAGVATGNEPGAPKVVIVARKSTPFGLVQNALVAAAAAKLAKLEVVVERDAGREGSNTPINLPSDEGLAEDKTKPIVILISWNKERAETERMVGSTPIPPGRFGNERIVALTQDEAKAARAEKREPVVQIDSGPLVPWTEIAALFDAARQAGVTRVEFRSPQTR